MVNNFTHEFLFRVVRDNIISSADVIVKVTISQSGLVDQASGLSVKGISTTGLALLMWRKFTAFLWSHEDGISVFHLGFQSLLDITSFWVAYRGGKLAKELQQFMSSASSKDAEELTVNPVIDPVEYAEAVTHLAQVEKETDLSVALRLGV